MNEQEFFLYVNAFLTGLSVLSIFDVWFRFRKLSVLKATLLLLSLCMAVTGFGHLWEHHVDYNRIFIAFPPTVAAFAGLFFFSLIYSHRSSMSVLLMFLFTFLFQVGVTIYYTFTYDLGLNVDLTHEPVSEVPVQWMRLFFLLTILPIAISILVNIRRKFDQDNVYYQRLRSWSLGLIGIFLIDLVSNVLKFNAGTLPAGKLITSLGHIATMLLVLYRPNFLNRLSGQLELLSLFSGAQPRGLDSVRFTKAFFDDCYFLKTEAEQEAFARLMNRDSAELAAFIQKEFKCTFTELINRQRIEYFMEMVRNGKFREMTIEDLALACGFSSRQNLQRTFRQFHGGTPSEFIQLHASK